jgi:AraC-like DNA-binding protein
MQQFHSHRDFFALYLVRRGRGIHRIEGRDFAMARGDVYIMQPGMVHGYVTGDGLVLDAIHFQTTLFDDATRAVLARTAGCEPLFAPTAAGDHGRWLHLTPAGFAQIDEIVAELRAEWQRGTEDAALLVRAHFLRLLLLLARRRTGQEAPERLGATGHEAIIAAAVRQFDTHFAERIRIEKVAGEVGLSKDRFTEVFAQVMGRTPSDYLRHVRLERADHLLRTTDATVAAIARETGFADAAHLTRALRAATGTTPRALRLRASRASS